jgi:hypothetical protein
MATAKKAELIEIKPLEMKEVTVRIVGDTPFIMHAWSAKAKREILYKEVFGKSLGKDAREPIKDFCSSMYWLTPMPEEFDEKTVFESVKTAKFGFPVTAFKQAAISAAYRMGWTKDKMSTRGCFFIEPDASSYYSGDLEVDLAKKTINIIPNVPRAEQLVEIHSDTPLMREDMVRVGMGSADIRYRGEFQNWSCNLKIKYNTNGAYRLDQILNMINAGGTVCGIGEWRPERDGQYGLYHIEA